MAYSGIYIAFDGLTREDASPWSSTAVLSDLEKKTIDFSGHKTNKKKIRGQN